MKTLPTTLTLMASLSLALSFMACQPNQEELSFYENPDPIVAPSQKPPGYSGSLKSLPFQIKQKKEEWEAVPEQSEAKNKTSTEAPIKELKPIPTAQEKEKTTKVVKKDSEKAKDKTKSSQETSPKTLAVPVKPKPKNSKVIAPGDASPIRKKLPVKKKLDTKPKIKTEAVKKPKESTTVKTTTPASNPKKGLEKETEKVKEPEKKSDSIRKEAAKTLNKAQEKTPEAPSAPTKKPSPTKEMPPVTLEGELPAPPKAGSIKKQ